MTSIFDGLVRDVRDVVAPEGSINAALLALPQQRVHTHDMKGRVLLFPNTGLVGVPFRFDGDGGYAVTVIDGSGCVDDDGREIYPRGGHDIVVSLLEMQTAIELTAVGPDTGWVASMPEPGHWQHCSPDLIHSGYDCGAGLRRSCRCEHGGSHDHWVTGDAGEATAAPGQEQCRYSDDWTYWDGVDGPVMICDVHGTPAPSEVYALFGDELLDFRGPCS